MFAVALLLWSDAAFAAECPRRTSLAEVARLVDVAEQSYALSDAASLAGAAADVERTVECLGEAMGRQDAAGVHLAEGLARWDPADPDVARPYLLAAKTLRGGRDAPLGISGLPKEDPLTAYWVELDADLPVKTRTLPPAWAARLQVDGRMGDPRRTDERPWVLQAIRSNSAVRRTFYVEPHEGPPPYARTRTVLGVASASALVLAVGVGAGAVGAGQMAEETRGDEAETWMSTNHTMVVGSLFFGSSAAVLGTTLLVSHF